MHEHDEHHDDLDEPSGFGHGRRRRRRMPPWARTEEAWAGGPPPGGMPFEIPIPGPPFGDRMFLSRNVGRRGRGRGRARRGDIRAAILLVLADRPMHGYEVMTELAERSGGVWRPSPGSVYPTLQQLEDEDLVRSEEIDQKRIFRLTDAGRAESERGRSAGSSLGNRHRRPQRRAAGTASRHRAAHGSGRPGRAGRHRRADQCDAGTPRRRAQGRVPPARRGRRSDGCG